MLDFNYLCDTWPHCNNFLKNTILSLRTSMGINNHLSQIVCTTKHAMLIGMILLIRYCISFWIIFFLIFIWPCNLYILYLNASTFLYIGYRPWYNGLRSTETRDKRRTCVRSAWRIRVQQFKTVTLYLRHSWNRNHHFTILKITV